MRLKKSRSTALAVMVLLSAVMGLLPGCGQVRPVLSQIVTVENRASITGRVKVEKWMEKDVIVALYLSEGEQASVQLDWVLPDEDGRFRLWMQPGKYYLVTYLDSDGDRKPRPGDPVAFVGDVLPQPITVEAKQTVEVGDLVIREHVVPEDLPTIRYGARKARANIGLVASFGDAAFERKNYHLGLWKPMDFVESVGPGLFLLDTYGARRTLVLLIHGMAGGPLDWRSCATAMRSTGLQPLLVYYPSGVSLDLVSDFMVDGIGELQARYGFKRIHLVGHSMGGLVARSFAKKLIKRRPSVRLASLTTINSPMEGLDSAALSVEHGHFVIPSWRDLATGSRFVADLKNWTNPDDLPYHLIFSYRDGESSDGVVPLRSQIPLWLQRDATVIRGFEGGHVALLNDPVFIRVLLDTLLALKR